MKMPAVTSRRGIVAHAGHGLTIHAAAASSVTALTRWAAGRYLYGARI